MEVKSNIPAATVPEVGRKPKDLTWPGDRGGKEICLGVLLSRGLCGTDFVSDLIKPSSKLTAT